tara:strand:- start:3021 stop:3722 length:702 start_codon:yes stop_codon:yes gene_type:complete
LKKESLCEDNVTRPVNIQKEAKPMFNIIIPARKGSKGFPKKNQLLLRHTLSKIPSSFHKSTIVSTDDDFIAQKIKVDYPEFKLHIRSKKSARDTASTKECIGEVVSDFNLSGDVVMLYLTYPNREWKSIIQAYKFFVDKRANSLLCKEPVKDHPFLCMYDLGHHKARQIVEHNLYRRQDYPKCFKISHMISIFKVAHIKNLNKNLYNGDTLFYKINPSLDVDTEEDYKKIGGR